MLKIILILNFVPRALRKCFDSKNNLTIESCGDFLIVVALLIVFAFVLFWILKKTH